MPTIPAKKNSNYGGTLVTQKYSPLTNIQYVRTSEAYYSAMIAHRWTLLNSANVLPRDLALVVPNWATVRASEAGKNPPLVVISSNRSAWMATAIGEAAKEADQAGVADFDNPSDLRALEARHARAVYSPPIYTPKRLGTAGARNVYIVVRTEEYMTYKRALAGLGVTVVGWSFQAPAGVANRIMSGFGASRYAAIEFCKYLRTQAPPGGAPPWDFAWLFDDNVVALSNFPGYTAVETALRATGGPRVCAGFHGGSKAESFAYVWDWARKEVKAGNDAGEDSPERFRGKQAAAVPTSATPAIVQQAALWNISYLATNHLNFAPVCLLSGEDVSLGNYFDRQSIPYLHYNGIGVVKEAPFADTSAGGIAATQARQDLVTWFATAESAATPHGRTAPPPVEIHPEDPGDGGDQTLSNFINNCVLPISQLAAQRADANVRANGKCHAVEQIMCGAIKAGFVSSAALTGMFKINGTVGQVIRPVSRA